MVLGSWRRFPLGSQVQSLSTPTLSNPVTPVPLNSKNHQITEVGKVLQDHRAQLLTQHGQEDKGVGKQDARGAAAGTKHSGAQASLTSQVHLVCRSPVGFLFAFVTGDRGIFEGTPIWLVAFQRQLLGPARQVEGCYIWITPLHSIHP